MRRGLRPNRERQRQAVDLRQRGLTLEQIAVRLGVTRAMVSYLLRAAATSRPARCRRCRKVIDSPVACAKDTDVLCLSCAERLPITQIGPRLLAYRVAAGLTQRQLADRAGLAIATISRAEQCRGGGRWITVASMLRGLGVNLTLDTSGLAVRSRQGRAGQQP